MKSVLYDFRTANEPWFKAVCDLYLKKINAFVPFEIVSLKTLKSERTDKFQKKDFETNELNKKITKDDYVIVFDEKGKTLTTEQFLQVVNRAELSGKKRIAYLIGGAYGLSDEIKNKAQVQVSLSSFVMNHLVAEAVVLEQIYRLYTIKNRIPYHNE